MKFLQLSVLATLGLGLIACGTTPDDTSVDTGDTGTNTGDTSVANIPLKINNVSWACDANGTTGVSIDAGDSVYTGPYTVDLAAGEWYYYLRTSNTAGGAYIDIVETGATPDVRWTEKHDLTSINFDDVNFTWEQWGVKLKNVTTTGAVNNTSTLFTCGTHSVADSLAVKFTIFDDSNNAVDCGILGYKSGEEFAGDNCYQF